MLFCLDTSQKTRFFQLFQEFFFADTLQDDAETLSLPAERLVDLYEPLDNARDLLRCMHTREFFPEPRMPPDMSPALPYWWMAAIPLELT